MLACITLFTVVTSASSFGSLQFDTITSETFSDGTSNEIGWIKFSKCSEGYGIASAPEYDSFSLTELIEISQYAVTVKIINANAADSNTQTDAFPGFGEDENYAIQADICSKPIFALNNGFELSFPISLNTDGSASILGSADISSDWIGSSVALNRLQNAACNYAAPRMLNDGVFYDSCSDGGLFVTTKPIPFPFFGAMDVCAWEMGMFGVDDQEKDISIWLGFDQNQQNCCKQYPDSDEYEYRQCFTQSPTTNPTAAPTVNYVDISNCSALQLTRPNPCSLNPVYPESTMIGCGFIDYVGGQALEVYVDTDNDDACTVESATAKKALSIAHCCMIPPKVQFSCTYPSERQLTETLSVGCASNEVAIGCQSTGSACIGYDDCSDLIEATDGNWKPPAIENDAAYMKDYKYYVEDIDNHFCTSHAQHFYNGLINVQASCCSVGSGYTLECKQVVGELDNYHSSWIFCNKVLGDGWFVTGCGAYVKGQESADQGQYIPTLRPEGSRCIIEAGRPKVPHSQGFYPIAQCCRIIEE